MTPELTYLTWVSLLTACLWIPYLADRVVIWGLMDSVGYPSQPKSQSLWAQRMMQAHSNAIENLVVFAALALALNAASISNSTTALACSVYFWARVIHVLAFTFKISWVRTLAFVAGFGCQLTMGILLLT